MLREETGISIIQICEWNDKSMGILYDNYYRALVSYGCQFVERELAEDIVQELFSVLWEQRPFSRASLNLRLIFIARFIMRRSIICVIRLYIIIIVKRFLIICKSLC